MLHGFERKQIPQYQVKSSSRKLHAVTTLYCVVYLFHPSCNETDQLMKYNNLGMRLSQADENEIFELTGCLSTCDKYEYAVQPDTTLNKVKEILAQNGEPNALGLKFYFLSGRHEVKEQVNF